MQNMKLSGVGKPKHFTIELCIENVPVEAIYACSVNMISTHFAQKNGLQFKRSPVSFELFAGSGAHIQFVGQATLKTQIGEVIRPTLYYVLDSNDANLVMVDTDFICKFELQLNPDMSVRQCF